MHIRKYKNFGLTENHVTPEKDWLDRRKFMTGLGIAGAGLLLPGSLYSAPAYEPNAKYKDAVPTDEELTTGYNNFYEYTLSKEGVKSRAKDMKTSPWQVEITGLVNKPMKLDVSDIEKMFSAEERIYRFRCVETWAAVIPWGGFPLRDLIAKVDPKSSAKYIKFYTFLNPEMASGQKDSNYPWPYTEGLRMDEAMHDLSFVATGMYGKKLPPQNGAPIRMVVPWKYGYKSIKSVVKIEFTEKEPPTFWNGLAPNEYGFYSNVNPDVSHPRWSQASEKLIGTWFGGQKTQLFNGYGEVAGLYKGMDLKKFH